MEMPKFDPRKTLSQSLHAQAADTSKLMQKLDEDILFLQDRISRIKASSTPRSSVLNTYTSMLKEREAVLSWLQSQSSGSVSSPNLRAAR